MVGSDRIERIFAAQGARWGLRGDPYLWDALKMRAIGRGLPETRDAFAARIRQDFDEIVGQGTLERDDFVGVKEFRRPRGGMSSGIIAPQAWRERLIPLLLARFDEVVDPS